MTFDIQDDCLFKLFTIIYNQILELDRSDQSLEEFQNINDLYVVAYLNVDVGV